MNLFSVPQAAERLGVTESLVRRWCRAGKLGVKVGGRWIVTESELEQFAAVPRHPGRPRKNYT